MQAQRGLGELRLLDFLTSALYGGRLSASRTGCLYPKDTPGTHFYEGLSRPQGQGLVGRKNVTEKSSDTNVRESIPGPNRNKYQEYFLGVKATGSVGLATIPPWRADYLEIMGAILEP
jgi:hypothetical protein